MKFTSIFVKLKEQKSQRNKGIATTNYNVQKKIHANNCVRQTNIIHAKKTQQKSCTMQEVVKRLKSMAGYIMHLPWHSFQMDWMDLKYQVLHSDYILLFHQIGGMSKSSRCTTQVHFPLSLIINLGSEISANPKDDGANDSNVFFLEVVKELLVFFHRAQ